MNLPGWLTLNGFVLLIDVMLLFSVKGKRTRTIQDRTYAQLLTVVLVLIMMDSFSRVRGSLDPGFPLWLDHLGTFFIFAFDPLGYLFALRYIDSWITPSTEQGTLRKSVLSICLCYVALNIIVVTANVAFGLGLVYSYTPDGLYTRGPLYIPRGVANMLFCLIVGMYALLRRRDIQERYSRFILAFPLIVLFSGFLQVFAGGAAFEYAGTVFACLLLYVYVQDRNMNVDYLTDLLNRRGIDRELNDLIAHGRQGSGFVACMIDLDRFKDINDKFGHDAGDEALRYMAGYLTRAFGPTYRIGRFGGDEFFAISGNTGSDNKSTGDLVAQANEGIDRLRDICATANASGERPYSIEFSAGCAAFEAEEAQNGIGDVIARVDELMYAQKIAHHMEHPVQRG